MCRVNTTGWSRAHTDNLKGAITSGGPRRARAAGVAEQGLASGLLLEVSCARDKNDRRRVVTGVASLGCKPGCGGELQRGECLAMSSGGDERGRRAGETHEGGKQGRRTRAESGGSKW